MIIRLLGTRSLGRVAAVVGTVVLALHLLLRGWGWTHEWMWAVSQLGFVTVFLGPLAAALGSWEGARWGRRGVPLSGLRGEARTVLATWSALAIGSVAPLVVGAVFVAVIVHLSGTPGWPASSVGFLLVPQLLVVAGWSAAGYLVGWYAPHPSVVAPLVGASSFGFTLLAFAALPGHLVDVGAGTGSLVGLAPVQAVTVAQTWTWSMVIVGALAGACLRTRAGVLAVVAVVAFGGLGFGFHLGERAGAQRLAAAAEPGMRCTGTPTVCLAPGYEQFRQSAHRAAAGAMAPLWRRGLHPPVEFTQDVGHVGTRPLVASLDARAVRGDRKEAAWGVVNALVPPGCDTFTDPAADRAFSQLADLLVEPQPVESIFPNPRLRTAPASATQAAIDVLGRCGTR